MTSVLWYVHDHGVGHLRRCQAVLPHLSSPVVVASSMSGLSDHVERPGVHAVEVRSDRVTEPVAGPGPFHHVPVGPVARERAADLLDTIARHDCSTAVVDVSVETAVLCRLAGLRVVVLRQSGRRDDAPHRLAHECADVVWVPQRRSLEPFVETSARVEFTGGFSRFDGCNRGDHEPGPRSARRGPRRVVALVGAGGTAFPEQAWRTVAPPAGTEVTVLGLRSTWNDGAVRSIGRVQDPLRHLRAADVVVSSAGWASVHDLASVGVPAALVAEPRPFDEQQVRVDAMARAGVAVGLGRWPTPDELGEVLDRCGRLDPQRWDCHYDHHGAQRAAAMIEEVHRGLR